MEFEFAFDSLVVYHERDADDVFARYAGIDRSRPPMSREEIIAEIREMRGHEDLNRHQRSLQPLEPK